MKKVIFSLICLFGLCNVYEAECTYSELKDLNVLSSHVNSTYNYNEENQTFTLTFTNLQKELIIEVNKEEFIPSNGIVSISGLKFGDNVKTDVLASSNTSCYGERLRIMNTLIPYLNQYYNSKECIGHEKLEVCSNKFLNYKLTRSTFEKLIRDDVEKKLQEQEKEKKEKKKDVSFLDKTLNYVKKIYIPVLLVIFTSLITFSICNVIYRKIRHGL